MLRYRIYLDAIAANIIIIDKLNCYRVCLKFINLIKNFSNNFLQIKKTPANIAVPFGTGC